MVCKDENIEENEIIDQDYMFEKRVTVRTVEEKNGENIDTFEITKVFVQIISGPYIFSKRFLQGSRARFYCWMKEMNGFRLDFRLILTVLNEQKLLYNAFIHYYDECTNFKTLEFDL